MIEPIEVPATLFGIPITEWNELRIYIEAYRLTEEESLLDIVRRLIRGEL